MRDERFTEPADRMRELDRMIGAGLGDTPARKIPKDWDARPVPAFIAKESFGPAKDREYRSGINRRARAKKRASA